MNILLINGPNLNLLGTREPEIYGNQTLSDIQKDLTKVAQQNGINLECFQSNHEGKIVDKIQDSIANIQGILINAGAFTHTSISIRDALVYIFQIFLVEKNFAKNLFLQIKQLEL